MLKEASISIRVYPNARKTELLGWNGDVLRIRIAAPPEKGKANRELLIFLGDILKTSPGNLAIRRGHTSRNKIVSAVGLGREEVFQRIQDFR